MFKIEKHTGIDKSFKFGDENISMFVDYDDVDHVRVDATIEMIRDILNKNWNEEVFSKKLREKLIEKWNENKYNLQDDFESFDEYMNCYF